MGFQSLFCWMMVPGMSPRARLLILQLFQSLFCWMMVPGSHNNCRSCYSYEVSILVLLDDGAWFQMKLSFCGSKIVSILVLLDDGAWYPVTMVKKVINAVSILVLLDDGAWFEITLFVVSHFVFQSLFCWMMVPG